MRYLALACDYDGTLATHGRVERKTLAALERVLGSGRKLILVTGRELKDLFEVFPQVNLFDYVVAENGAVLYQPEHQQERLLGEPPAPQFIAALKGRGVEPLSAGRCIVATWHPNETRVLEIIQELGLELQVVFNKGAVMVLPSGVNKGTGLSAALLELRLSPHNVVGIGDAENDHAFLGMCECSVAVANALETIKQRADIVTQDDHGNGVIELIDDLVENDLLEHAPQLGRHTVLLGQDDQGTEIRLQPYGTCILVAGPSGSGKSTVVTAVAERLAQSQYQFCVVDPEGDFESLPGAVTLGDAQGIPRADEIIQLLERFENPVINLLGAPLADRPAFFAGMLPRIQELRVARGRPHWLVLDEAHHLLPSSWRPAAVALPETFGAAVLITVHPERVSPAALSVVDVVLAVGGSPGQTLKAFCEVIGEVPPPVESIELEKLEVLGWFRKSGGGPIRIRIEPGTSERRRHRRKYAEGDVHEKSFYFRGPEGKLNLRAQNLSFFVQIAEGVDDETWLHHLRRRDYSGWVREAIKDGALAEEIARVEESNISAAESRALIKAAIERQYTSAA